MDRRIWVGETAVDIAAAVRTGAVSPVTVVEQHLARIEEADGRINAFRQVRDAEVRAEAAALAERPDLAELPLAGVPVAIKDNTDIADCPTSLGSAASTGEPAAADGELAARLRAAGALLIGKTNVPELCQWPFTETSAFGSTRNPWNLGHISGGSSGGSAAAVAAAMVPVALGSDGGGSIRIPSSCCGVFGVKPGPRVVPSSGSDWCGMSEFGPIATTVADATLLLDALAGGADYRRDVPDPELPLRIGLTTSAPALGVRVGAEPRAVVAGTAAALREAGHTVTEVRPPWRIADTAPFLRRFFAGVSADAAGLPIAELEPRTRAVVRTGRLLGTVLSMPSGPPHATATRFARFFRDYDVLLSPTLATTPPHLGAFSGKGMVTTLLASARFMPFTPPVNVAGYPGMSVPGGRSGAGLPIGVQLVAAPGGEGTLLAVAAQLEQLRPWPRQSLEV